MMRMKPVKSAAVIARALHAQGFSDAVGNMVEKYWMHNICNPRGKKRVRKLDREIHEMCKKLTDAEKLILGKFISLHKRMSFDTGLRMGIVAFARKTDKEFQMVEMESPTEEEHA